MAHHRPEKSASFLFDCIHEPADETIRSALADIVSLVRDVLALPEPQGYRNDFQLSSAGARVHLHAVDKGIGMERLGECRRHVVRHQPAAHALAIRP
jgi:hypothetical protein